MKPASFSYHDPATLAEALDLLARREGARVLAGGQSLMAMMNFRFAQPDDIVDVNRIASLAEHGRAGDRWRFGAMTRQRTIEFSDEIAAACPILIAALSNVGHRQTRNRGTIGGSLCHFDPTAELVNSVLLHDGATLDLASATGTRQVAASDFFLGYMTTALAEGEMLTGIELPLWPRDHGYAFIEVARRHGDFAMVAVGALLSLDPLTGRIARAALSVAGATEVPLRFRAIEAALVGEMPTAARLTEIAQGVEIPDAMGDVYVSSDYRRHLARVLVRRALTTAAARATDRMTAEAAR